MSDPCSLARSHTRRIAREAAQLSSATSYGPGPALAEGSEGDEKMWISLRLWDEITVRQGRIHNDAGDAESRMIEVGVDGIGNGDQSGRTVIVEQKLHVGLVSRRPCLDLPGTQQPCVGPEGEVVAASSPPFAGAPGLQYTLAGLAVGQLQPSIDLLDPRQQQRIGHHPEFLMFRVVVVGERH